MIKWFLVSAALILSPWLYAKSRHRGYDNLPMRAVDTLDVNRFLGTWYEIASLPSGANGDCGNAIVQYNRSTDGKIEMLNICRRGDNGRVVETLGLGNFLDQETHSKMSISFMPQWMQWTGLGEGQLWVIDLAPDYSYAVVSEPGRRFVRILSRTPSISKETFDAIGNHLLAQNFSPDRLVASRPNSVTAR